MESKLGGIINYSNGDHTLWTELWTGRKLYGTKDTKNKKRQVSIPQHLSLNYQKQRINHTPPSLVIIYIIGMDSMDTRARDCTQQRIEGVHTSSKGMDTLRVLKTPDSPPSKGLRVSTPSVHTLCPRGMSVFLYVMPL